MVNSKLHKIALMALMMFTLLSRQHMAFCAQDRVEVEWVVFEEPATGQVIRALYAHPSPGKKLPVVIYQHDETIEKIDYAGGKEQGYDVADFVRGLSDHQFVAIAPMRVEGLDFDSVMQGVLAYLRTKPDVDMNRIGMIGFSKGAMMALQAAPSMPELKAVVAMSPAALARTTRGESELPKIQVPVLVTLGQQELQDSIGQNAQHDVVEVLQRLGKKIEFKSSYPGNHAWFCKVRQEYWSDIIAFLNKQLNPASPVQTPPGAPAGPDSGVHKTIAPRSSGVGGSTIGFDVTHGVNFKPKIKGFVRHPELARDIRATMGGFALEIEAPFSNYNNPNGKDSTTMLRLLWEKSIREMDEEGAAKMYGKEFFGLFLQHYQLKFDATLRYLAKDFDGAKAQLVKARAIAHKLQKMKTDKSIPSTLWDRMVIEINMYLGVIDVAQGNTVGMTILQNAYKQADLAEWQKGMALATFLKAVAAEKCGDPNFKKYFQMALLVAKHVNMPVFISRIYYKLGVMSLDVGNFDDAIKNLEECVKTSETMRASITPGEVHFEGNNPVVYCALMKALWSKGEMVKAFELADNAKCRSLSDLLKLQQAKRNSKVKASLFVKEQHLLQHIESLEMQARNEDDEELTGFKKRHAKVMEAIKKADPEYASLKNTKPMELRQVQSMLDDQTAILEFHIDTEFVLAWLITNKSIRWEKITMDGLQLTDKVQSTTMLMGKPNVPTVYKLLGQLYEALIGPFDKDLKGKNILVVPDVTLAYLPFAALMDKDGKYLIENHAVWMVPSATVLKYCIARRKSGSNAILMFGNPDLADRKMDLPFAQAEAENIAKQFPETKLYARKEATETQAKKSMESFDIIHLACHGELKPEDPMPSCLKLVPDKDNDGNLEVGEIFDMQLKAQLVVLSGCQTGQGTFLWGNEIVGLTRAFLYAGTPSVIASFWKVDDDATSTLMTQLYKNVGTETKAEALRKAQLATMKIKKHPYYWASFYLVGDGK